MGGCRGSAFTARSCPKRRRSRMEPEFMSAEPHSDTGTSERKPEPESVVQRPWVFRALLGVALVVFLVGLVGGGYQGKLTEVQKNDNSAFLPGSAEATKVDKITTAFNTNNTIPGFLVYHRPGGLTPEDRAKIAR